MFTDERHKLGRRRHVLGDEKHEDGVGQQNGDAECDLLTGVRRQTERQETQHVQRYARQNYVEHKGRDTRFTDAREHKIVIATSSQKCQKTEVDRLYIG